MKLLLISNSTNAGEEYLRYPMPEIGRFLQGVSEIVFVPYAAVTFSYAEYEKKVQARFSELGIRVRSVHRAKDPARMVREAEALCVGGGNTFALAKKMQEQGLMSSLPLANNLVPIKRALTTTSTAIFVPFTTQELYQSGKESLYYGLNALSNNLIMVDRKKLKNPNGLILGTPGSGKSFSAKREITNAFLVTDDDIIICDPEAEVRHEVA